jgi:hypothetical protein
MFRIYKARRLGVNGFTLVKFWLLLLCPLGVRAGAVLLEPAPYLSFTNSPFDATGFNYFYLETLEDGALNTPGVTINNGWIITGSGNLVDSVDADDGIVDGSGTNGYSLLSGGVQTNLTLTFHAADLGGQLPTHAGMVCTDIGDVLFGQFGVGDLTFSARDAADVLLGSVLFTNFGNGSVQGSGAGATAEDRFFGVINPGGISSISLSVNNSVDWEVDHLQYGYFVPELRIQHSAPDEVVLAWSTNAVDYALQETPSLPATNWTTVPTPPATIGNEHQVTVTPLSSNRFYRLIGQ